MEVTKNLSVCSTDAIPSIPEYLSATTGYGISLVTIATVTVIIVLVMFIDTLRYIMKNSSSRMKAHTAFVIAVYPIVALLTYFAILVPRAHLLTEGLTQGVFMAAMYQLFCLFVTYCGGEAEVVRKAKPTTLNLRVSPCCCWPCCFFLPPVEVTKGAIQTLRLLVLQLPVVQGLVYLVLLVMWAERESLYQVNYMYMQPVIITSILFGVWAMAITVHLLRGFLGDEFAIQAKFIVLQMVLVLAKFQGLIARSLVWAGVLPCSPPITAVVYGNLIYNISMLAEMVLLGFVARKLYRRSLPDCGHVPTHISTIGSIMATDLIHNNNNGRCDDFNLKFNLENGKTGHVNIAVDVRE